MEFWVKECVAPERFEYWSGAKDTVKYLTDDELEMIWGTFFDSDMTGEIPSSTDINDFFWFETDYIAKMLGYADFDELIEDRKDV